MPEQPCPPPFRTERLAKRGAWSDRARGTHTEPYNCVHCGQWHLRPKASA